jgi:cell division protein FtsW
VNQSLIALGSGGAFGQGLGASRQKLLFLPCEYSDFVLSITGEELGFLGTSGVVLLFVLFVWKGFRVACRAPDLHGFLLGVGIVSAIGLQALLNMAVVTALLPPKGISLPFVSFGGSGLLFTMMGVGVLMNVAAHGEREPLAVPAGAPAV